MSIKDGEDAKRWLRKIDVNQNLEKIDDITLTRMSDRLRWFVSRLLSPIFNMGYYNEETGSIVMGPIPPFKDYAGNYSHVPIDVSFIGSEVSAATTDLTVTDAQTWEILGLTARNGTQQSDWTFLYSVNGLDYYHLPSSSSHARANGGAAAAQDQIGWSPKTFVITGSGTDVIIRATAGTFAAGNDIDVRMMYRRLA